MIFVLTAASEGQLDQARTAVERAVISRVYTYAMYPNGDGDINRDQLVYYLGLACFSEENITLLFLVFYCLILKLQF